MTQRALLLAAALSIAAFGCAPPSRAPSVPSWPPLYRGAPGLAPPTIEEVSLARGFPLGARVETETLDHDAFVRALRRQEKVSDWTAQYADLYLSALSMAKPSSGAGAAAQRSYDESVSGFYDPGARKLYLRRDTNERPLAGEVTLAHEEEHALQDRFFGIPDFAELGDADQALAAKALFEGDATLTSALLHHHRTGLSDAVILAVLARLSDADYAKAEGKTSAREEVPALARATATWPVRRGATFAALLAASGGWQLLNAALRSPPQTTEQVLHIEKYVAGERAIEVRAPGAPDGYLAVEHGRMGELQARYFLAECVATSRAEEAASGWGGDAFQIATQGPRSALLWSTVWDDERAAERFLDALDARKACPGGDKPPFAAVREGARVAFVQGLDDDATRAREARKLLTLVEERPPSLPPLGEVRLALRPPVPLDFAHRGHVERGRFVDPVVGLESDLGGMTLLADDGYELLATDGAARVGATVRWAPPSDALRTSLLDAIVGAAFTSLPPGHVFDLGTSRVALASSASVEARTIRVSDKRIIRLALVPVCAGGMTIALAMSWDPKSPGGERATDAWLRSVRASDASPACDALKTLRDPKDAPSGPDH